MIIIRKARLDDAESLSLFIKQLDIESPYLLYDANERKNDTAITKTYLQSIQENNKSIVYIAKNSNNKIIGFACGEVSHLKRLSHVMKGNIGVLKKYHGLGIGKMLADKIITDARKAGIMRIEVTVIKSNIASLNLCKKMGLEIDGFKKNSIKIGDQLHDEYLLSKLIIN